ncbi:MAG: hypothetical protein ABIQ18_37760 [Umezawaea sp.]
MSGYLTGEFISAYSDEGMARLEQVVAKTWTAEEHRAEARRLLTLPGSGASNALAAAQVHATLALSLTDREQGA